MRTATVLTMDLRFLLFAGWVALAFCLSADVSAESQPETSGRQPLWKEDANKSFITVHRPPKGNGTAVVICPGGGYGGLVKGPEGHGIAKWLNAHGITGIVLEYELPRGRSEVPLRDAQRAIRLARANAEQWKIDPKRVGIMGFSAGGHLASTAGTQFDRGNSDATDPVERLSCRPDFMILVYPVISMSDLGHAGSRRNLLGKEPKPAEIKRFSNETQVTRETPPAFLAHAKDDKVVLAANSLAFHKALKAKQVASEYLELPRGGHGLNRYQGPMWEAWQKASLRWLGSQGVLPKQREEPAE